MTDAAVPGDPSRWFCGLTAGGPGKEESEEARKWERLRQAREGFLRHVGGGEGEGGWPAPAPEVGMGFWSPVPVLGFRLWYVFASCLMGARVPWSRPGLEAWCGLRGPGAPHIDGGCRCGIYALKEPESLARPEIIRRRPGAGIAYGLVALSGVVVEHERGYRAARAEAMAMVVIYGGRAVGGADGRWIERLFSRPDGALDEVEQGRWPRVRPMVPSAEEVVRFLHDEAARLEEAWTSASRSE